MSNDIIKNSNRVLWGAKAIAEHLGLSTRQVGYLHETRALPIGKLNGRLFARPASLEYRLAELERAELERLERAEA